MDELKPCPVCGAECLCIELRVWGSDYVYKRFYEPTGRDVVHCYECTEVCESKDGTLELCTRFGCRVDKDLRGFCAWGVRREDGEKWTN